ncbi:MAG: hypothetical protein FD149_2330 [Rhodospirillaceae bacterium]|nr:MAG: hypothetical protein FD149_2330 [Rhodospirillaceae bacterium]
MAAALAMEDSFALYGFDDPANDPLREAEEAALAVAPQTYCLIA